MIQRKVTGISLIEVLITVLVMAVGMLGVAALQVKSLNTSQESYSKSQAVVVLEGMADLMRSDYEFIHSDEPGNNAYSAQGNDWCTTPPTECTASSCTKEEQAQTNIAQACNALIATGIPGAKMGAKCSDIGGGPTSDPCSPGSMHLLYVSWQPTVRDDTDGEATYSGPMTRCHNEFGLNPSEDCVFIELVP